MCARSQEGREFMQAEGRSRLEPHRKGSIGGKRLSKDREVVKQGIFECGLWAGMAGCAVPTGR